MSAAGWRVAIGRATLDAASPELASRIEAQNAREALPGLEPDLNPHLIDPAKWRALVAAVTPAAARALAGRPVLLDPMGLRIATSSPTTPGSFGPSVRLMPGEAVGEAVLARTDAPYDCALAQSRAAASRRRTEQADGAVKAKEAAHEPAGAERQVRYAVALTWRENAAAVAGCRHGDQAAEADRKAAADAAERFILLGGSMQ